VVLGIHQRTTVEIRADLRRVGANFNRMANEPRRHHYLPQFYLSGFSSPNGELWLTGLKDGKTWKGTPTSVGHQRDFYRVEDLPGVGPNDLERKLADFEGSAASVVRGISTSKQLPEDEDAFSYLINLVALMVARVPRTREVFSRPIVETSRMMLQILASDERRLRSAYEGARQKDPSLPENPDYDKMRETVSTGRYVLNVSQNYQLKQLFEIADTVLPLLAERLWSLLIAPEGVDFLTSDCPVAIEWTRPQPPSPFGAAFGPAETDVTFPLTRRFALLGRFEGPAETAVVSLKDVASINTRTCKWGQRFACSPKEDLVWLMNGGTIGNAKQLVAFLEARPAPDAEGPVFGRLNEPILS
jgi:hypothetical protein